MHRTVSLKLLDPPEDELRCTMIAFTEACRYISTCIQQGAPVNRRKLHQAYYQILRKKFQLPSQMAQSVIRVVVGAFKARLTKGEQGEAPTFRRLQTQFQYNRDWSFSRGLVSLRTLAKRRRIKFIVGQYQQEKYMNKKEWRCGGARLIERKGHFYLNITLEKESPRLERAITSIGIDRGIRALAVARAQGMEPFIVGGGRLLDYRSKMLRLRRRLQEKGTRAARRALRHLRGRENRFVLDYCRRTAKHILQYAKNYDYPVIVFERLVGIREQVKIRSKKGRRNLNSWPFYILKQAICDKAEELGIPVATVNPAYTSQRCPRCGIISKRHRQQDNYRCRNCHYQNNADVVAATNIAWLWFNDVDRIEPGVLSTTQTCHLLQTQQVKHKPQSVVSGS